MFVKIASFLKIFMKQTIQLYIIIISTEIPVLISDATSAASGLGWQVFAKNPFYMRLSM